MYENKIPIYYAETTRVFPHDSRAEIFSAGEGERKLRKSEGGKEAYFLVKRQNKEEKRN